MGYPHKASCSDSHSFNGVSPFIISSGSRESLPYGPAVERLMTIDGVGQVTALTWALEIDDPGRFANLKQAQSYCGLCSGQKESAGKSKSGPLSKKRNAHLQTALIEAAKLAPCWNAQLARVHAASLAQDKNRNRASCAVARKLIAYLMAVDKSGNPYEDRSSVK
jgi:transposase